MAYGHAFGGSVPRGPPINILGVKSHGETNVTVTPDIVLTDDVTILVIGEYKALQKCFQL